MSQEAEDDVGSSPSRWAYFDGRQNHLRDVARGIVSLPRPLTQVLWRGRTEEHKERHGSLVPGFQLCHACSCSRVLAFTIR